MHRLDRSDWLLASAILASWGVASLGATPARAETMKECSVKYQAAKTAGTLNGASWKTFRATQCSSTPAAAPAAATPPTSASPAPASPAPAAPAPAAPIPSKPAATAPAAAPSAGPGHTAPAVVAGNAIFPSAIDPKYASLTAGKARMKTCDDQYHANKANGGNGGLKWVQKGGGYYPECNKHLKGL